jgi:hypothetical protein
MVVGFRYGQMEVAMMVIGEIIEQMEEVVLFMLMVIFMKGTGLMIKLMAMEDISI